MPSKKIKGMFVIILNKKINVNICDTCSQVLVVLKYEYMGG